MFKQFSELLQRTNGKLTVDYYFDKQGKKRLINVLKQNGIEEMDDLIMDKDECNEVIEFIDQCLQENNEKKMNLFPN